MLGKLLGACTALNGTAAKRVGKKDLTKTVSVTWYRVTACDPYKLDNYRYSKTYTLLVAYHKSHYFLNVGPGDGNNGLTVK